MDDSDLARSTKARYPTIVESFVVPAMGGLRLRELTIPAVDRFLRANADTHGATTAKGARSVLSIMVGLAMRHGAMTANPTRDARRIRIVKKTVRAMTPVETREMLAAIAADACAVDLDLVDLVAFMAATGVRIGEACGLRPPHVDLELGLVEVNASVTDFGPGAPRRPGPLTKQPVSRCQPRTSI